MIIQNILAFYDSSRPHDPRLYEPNWDYPDFLRGNTKLTVFLLDVSGSMASKDYDPSRLEAGVNAIEEFIRKRRKSRPNDCLGLVTFDSRASVACPLAWLKDASQVHCFEESLSRIKIGGGTRLDLAFDLASTCLLVQICGISMAQQKRVRLIVLTDGHSENDPEPRAREIKENGVIIEIIGIGGSPNEVNEPLLKRCASFENGKLLYRFIGDGDSESLIAHFGNIAFG